MVPLIFKIPLFFLSAGPFSQIERLIRRIQCFSNFCFNDSVPPLFCWVSFLNMDPAVFWRQIAEFEGSLAVSISTCPSISKRTKPCRLGVSCSQLHAGQVSLPGRRPCIGPNFPSRWLCVQGCRGGGDGTEQVNHSGSSKSTGASELSFVLLIPARSFTRTSLCFAQPSCSWLFREIGKLRVLASSRLVQGYGLLKIIQGCSTGDCQGVPRVAEDSL